MQSVEGVMEILRNSRPKEGVVAIGEIGYDEQTPLKDRYFGAPLELAKELDLPEMVDTPHLEPFRDGLDDLIIGLGEGDVPYPIAKLDAHLKSTRHMAVSVFILDGDRLLLQQRAAGKYHSPGLWANTACSHLLWGETAQACAERTLQRELGISPAVSQFTVTHYEAAVPPLFENEVVHCFVGRVEGALDLSGIDRREVDAVAWVSLAEVTADAAQRPERYAPWFRIYVARGLLTELTA